MLFQKKSYQISLDSSRQKLIDHLLDPMMKSQNKNSLSAWIIFYVFLFTVREKDTERRHRKPKGKVSDVGFFA